MGVVITVSRQLGSEGSYIATAAAQELHFRYLDREILQRAAEMSGYPDDQMVQALARQEEVPRFLERVLSSLSTMPPVPAVPSATLREGMAYADVVNEMVTQEVIAKQRRERAAEGYTELVRGVIQACADEGNVVIAGRGGQVVLRDWRNVLHVRVIASVETRIRNVMAREDISREEAKALIEESDRRRTRYLQRFYDAKLDDPRLYHLILNTDNVPVVMGAQILIAGTRWLATVR
jgi:cytidylate kinase